MPWGGPVRKRGRQTKGWRISRAESRALYAKRTRATRRRLFRKGYDRTSGFYGRYSGSKAEFKFHDVDVDDADIASTGTIQTALLTIPEGNGEEQRVGRRITIRSINWRYTVEKLAATASSATGTVVRIILVLDKQANGAAPGVTDILESADFQSFNQLANKSRFRTLMDRTVDVNALSGGGNGTAEDYGIARYSDTFFKQCNIPIEYDNSATTGVVTTIRSNNLVALLITEASNIAGFESKMRIRYSDS